MSDTPECATWIGPNPIPIPPTRVAKFQVLRPTNDNREVVVQFVSHHDQDQRETVVTLVLTPELAGQVAIALLSEGARFLD